MIYPMAKLFSDCIKCLGPYIGFSGLISSKKVQMDPLTPLVPFAFHPRDTQMRMMVARMFAAFRVAIDQLKAYYEGISDVSDPRGKNLQSQYPYEHCYHNGNTNNQFVHFKYMSQISDRLVFIAETEAQETIIVKFSRTYSKETHELCASKGFAPVLRAYEDICGGWHMVIMDYMKPEEYLPYHLRSDKQYSFPDPNILQERFTEIVQTLHTEDYVHGDIRDSNFLVKIDGTGAMLLDFDWAGKEGIVHYPIDINCLTVERPPEVKSGAHIKKQHDLDMLNIMFRRSNL